MNNDLLTDKLNDLRKAGVSDDFCRNLEAYIHKAEETRLFSISPYRLADEWGMDKNEVLNGFLYSSVGGIFDLEWNIRCPTCKGFTDTTKRLKELVSSAHCEYCQIDINAGFDDDVEITFNINQNIRATGPVSAEDVAVSWMQFEETITLNVEPGSTDEINLELETGTYYMFSPVKKTGAPLLIKNEGDENGSADFFYENHSIQRSNTHIFKNGKKRITLENRSNAPLEVIFTKSRETPWVSGADMATNQLFRDYFSSELISSDETFSIKNMVFVFTDIKGSTDLYEKRGDSKAYYLVKEHFRIMNKIVARNNGAVVKTIGDAVMATFLSSPDSIRAVFEMQQEFERFNAKENSRDDIIIKIGLHRGGCLAVTSNDKLDYFGRTVNIAARVQGLSGGNDIMISGDLYEENGINQLIDTFRWKKKEIEASLKGIEGLYRVIHLYPESAPA